MQAMFLGGNLNRLQKLRLLAYPLLTAPKVVTQRHTDSLEELRI
jgi:hypothetical protein